MLPVTASALNTVHCGDCVDLLYDLPRDSVDIILTSPPYNVGLKYEDFIDDIPHDEFVKFNRSWLTATYRVASATSRLYTILHENMIWWFREEAERVGWNFAQILTWCKPNFVGGSTRISGDWRNMTEFILLFRKGNRTPMAKDHTVTSHNWFTYSAPQSNFRNGRHGPAELPVELCQHILQRTPGHRVIDPFAGSGSVLVAAKRLGLEYWGADLSPTMVARSMTRLSKTTGDLPRRVFLPGLEQSALELPA